MTAWPDTLSCALRGERLRDLADLEGMTMKDLARSLDVTPAQISRIANGKAPLTAAVVERATDVYGLFPSFFAIVPLPQDHAAVTFRKRSTSTVTEDRRVAALFTEASRLWREASRRSGYKTADLPDPRDHDGNIEATAVAVREMDGLDEDDPVPNLTRMIERRGVGVINGLDPDRPDSDRHSGVSRPSRSEDRPLVATVNRQPGAVSRLTLAHELGHVVLDQDLATPPSARSWEERRAFMFAGAILLPESVMRQRVDEGLTLHSYLRIKADYGVSVGAIITRAEKLGVISRRRARSLRIQLNSQGWRHDEPVDVPDEQIALLPQALERVWPVNTDMAASQDTGAARHLIQVWAQGTSTPPSCPVPSNVISLSSVRRP